MVNIEDIRKDAALHGIEPGQVVRVVTTEPLGPDAVTVYLQDGGRSIAGTGAVPFGRTQSLTGRKRAALGLRRTGCRIQARRRSLPYPSRSSLCA